MTMPAKECKDHLGNRFNSKAEMAKFYGITTKRLITRIASGHTLEDALTMPLGKNGGIAQLDHLGNSFRSVTAMCNFYNIKRKTYENRIEKGWSKKDALTVLPMATRKPVSDHQGKEYPSKAALCRAYGIGTTTYDRRMRSGWTLEEILLTPKQDLSVRDHLGNKYGSQSEMCREYNIEFDTFVARIKAGWSLGNALTISINKTSSYYEILTMEYLQSISVSFMSQVVTPGCFSSGGKHSRFDLYIPGAGFIEIDGEGHFKQIASWDFEKTAVDDEIKTLYCERSKIPLLRIRYDQMQDGTYIDLIEDFLCNKTSYIHRHNKYLPEKEYYAEREENLFKSA